MDIQKVLYKFWLVLGFTQILCLSACQQNNPSTENGPESLLSNTEPASAHVQEAAMPVRISRAFFESPVQGIVQQNNDEYETTTTWHEEPPTAPPPTGPVLGDFREHRGCAYYEKTNGIQLCFNVVPDVSSIGVNAKEVTVEGICDGDYQSASFVSAKQQSGELTVNFVGICKGALQSVKLTLRQAETRL